MVHDFHVQVVLPVHAIAERAGANLVIGLVAALQVVGVRANFFFGPHYGRCLAEDEAGRGHGRFWREAEATEAFGRAVRLLVISHLIRWR